MKLILDETITMCSGVGCPNRNNCYRYKLNKFFDTIAVTPHSNPEWLDPAFDARKGTCRYFRQIRYMDE